MGLQTTQTAIQPPAEAPPGAHWLQGQVCGPCARNLPLIQGHCLSSDDRPLGMQGSPRGSPVCQERPPTTTVLARTPPTTLGCPLSGGILWVLGVVCAWPVGREASACHQSSTTVAERTHSHGIVVLAHPGTLFWNRP